MNEDEINVFHILFIIITTIAICLLVVCLYKNDQKHNMYNYDDDDYDSEFDD